MAAPSKGSACQQQGLRSPGQPLSCFSPASTLLFQTGLIRLGLGLSLRGRIDTQRGIEEDRHPAVGQRGPQVMARSCPTASVPLARLGQDTALELFQPWFLLHLTQTSRVLLLLFIHREIAHP